MYTHTTFSCVVSRVVTCCFFLLASPVFDHANIFNKSLGASKWSLKWGIRVDMLLVCADFLRVIREINNRNWEMQIMMWFTDVFKDIQTKSDNVISDLFKRYSKEKNKLWNGNSWSNFSESLCYKTPLNPLDCKLRSTCQVWYFVDFPSNILLARF